MLNKLRDIRLHAKNAMRALLTRPLAREEQEYSYSQDGLKSIHNCDFMQDVEFIDAYCAGDSTGSWQGNRIHWRVKICCWAARHALTRTGDFVECGVNRGGMAKAVQTYSKLRNTNRTFWLLDTYSGLSETHLTESERKNSSYLSSYANCLADVQETFADCPNIQIIPGTVPETLKFVTSEKIAYLSIDMNCTMPEIAAVRFFWPKLVDGAIIVLDDYGWPGHLEQKLAMDCFAKEAGKEVLPLPTGQGILIK